MIEHYSRADFERYDSKPWKNGEELRFLCLECGGDKARDNAHRSLRLRLSGDRRGCFLCGRCHLKGKIKDEWTERPRLNRRERAVAAIASSRFQAKPAPVEPPDGAKVERIAARMEGYRRAFASSDGARYLAGRGIPEEVAELAGVGYAARWEHWNEAEPDRWELLGADRRVVFPVYDREGRLVAISGRAIDAEFHRAKFISQGPKSLGLFTSPGALSSRVVAVCEAAIDALALWLCGVPAVAGIGTTFPDWMPRALAFKDVLVALDADGPGDAAAVEVSASLLPLGARVFRFRAEGAKDWGAVLETMGAEKLRHGLVGFAEESDDFERACHADDLAMRGHMEGAHFVAGLIEDGEMRESFRASMCAGVSLWQRGVSHPGTHAMVEAFGALGVEVVSVSPTTVRKEEAA